MKYSKAKRIVSVDCGALSADKLYEHKAALTDAFYSSRGDYGAAQLLIDGYIVPIASESASGFMPKDKFLFQTICFRLDQCETLLNGVRVAHTMGEIKKEKNYDL